MSYTLFADPAERSIEEGTREFGKALLAKMGGSPFRLAAMPRDLERGMVKGAQAAAVRDYGRIDNPLIHGQRVATLGKRATESLRMARDVDSLSQDSDPLARVVATIVAKRAEAAADGFSRPARSSSYHDSMHQSGRVIAGNRAHASQMLDTPAFGEPDPNDTTFLSDTTVISRDLGAQLVGAQFILSRIPDQAQRDAFFWGDHELRPLRLAINDLAERIGAGIGALYRMLGVSSMPPAEGHGMDEIGGEASRPSRTSQPRRQSPQDARDSAISYVPGRPAKAAGLHFSDAELRGHPAFARGAASVRGGSSIAKSMDRALELNLAGQLDEGTYREYVSARDLLSRATKSAREFFKREPEHLRLIRRISTAPISQLDRQALLQALA